MRERRQEARNSPFTDSSPRESTKRVENSREAAAGGGNAPEVAVGLTQPANSVSQQAVARGIEPGSKPPARPWQPSQFWP